MRQQELAYGAAEGSYRERWGLIASALECLASSGRIKPDLHLRVLLQTIFERTAGGKEVVWAPTYRELAAWPAGLGCSLSKARATVDQALALGLIVASPQGNAVGGRGANAYAIDWDGVRSVSCQRWPHVAREQGPVATEQGPVATEQGPAFSEQGPVARKQGPVATEQGTPAQPIPAGETPRARAHARAHAPSTEIPSNSPSPSTATTEVEEASVEAIAEAAPAVFGLLFPSASGPLVQAQDQRTVYRLTRLWCSPTHGGWIRRLLEDAHASAKKPIAWVQANLPVYAPRDCDVRALLASIDVPRWALATPGRWRNGACVQRE